MSIRQIARQFGHSRKTVRHALVHAEPHPEPSTRNRWAPKLGPFQALIDQILTADDDAPPKQRHTAAQVFRRLRDEHGYAGRYAQVQRYVRKHRPRRQETFIPLEHLPGRRLEADFGHIHVDFPDGRRLVPFLVTAWAYSNAPFVLALPFERTEAVLEGMVAAFEFFGAVPREVWWDNPRTVATLVLLGRERQAHPRYAALASHYAFEPRFCMPARGNEKPDAEGAVKAVRRRFATPVPRVAGLGELNALLRGRCEAERDRVVQSLSGPFLIKDRLAEALACASPPPGHRFDPCVIRPAVVVDKYQTVASDGNRYSVPRRYAFEMVTVKGYVDRVVIAARGQVVAAHERPLAKQTLVLDPIHYLAALGKKPGALDHSPVFRDWDLPGCFAALRVALEERHGALPGSRRFVQVLRLLGEHPMSRVRQAIEACTRDQLYSAEAVAQRTRSLAATAAAGGTCPEAPAAPRVEVPLPDLGRFDQLLSGPATGGAVSVSFA
jgi:transposase